MAYCSLIKGMEACAKAKGEIKQYSTLGNTSYHNFTLEKMPSLPKYIKRNTNPYMGGYFLGHQVLSQKRCALLTFQLSFLSSEQLPLTQQSRSATMRMCPLHRYPELERDLVSKSVRDPGSRQSSKTFHSPVLDQKE